MNAERGLRNPEPSRGARVAGVILTLVIVVALAWSLVAASRAASREVGASVVWVRIGATTDCALVAESGRNGARLCQD